jgi:hypothetical protein
MKPVECAEWEFNMLIGGAFYCPVTGELTLPFSSTSDDKFMCTSCTGTVQEITHRKAECKKASYQEALDAGVIVKRGG